jgi:hypothetical protein
MRIPRRRLAAAAAAIALGAATAIIIGSVPGTARQSHAGPPRQWHAGAARPATRPAPVIVDCLNKDQIRPSGFVLACADANSLLKGMHWSAWNPAASGTGTLAFNDCIPYCAQGTFRSFPVRIVLSRPEPLPQHPALRYYTRITITFPGRHCFTAQGKQTCYPVTTTTPLRASLPGLGQRVNVSSV